MVSLTDTGVGRRDDAAASRRDHRRATGGVAGTEDTDAEPGACVRVAGACLIVAGACLIVAGACRQRWK